MPSSTKTFNNFCFSIPDLIAKKRDGLKLETEEIQYFINGLSNGNVQECHIGAMLMAIYLRGMKTRNKRRSSAHDSMTSSIERFPCFLV